MKKARYNVSEVAELLIEEMESFKQSTEQIKRTSEELKKTTVKISADSLQEFEKLIIDHEKKMARDEQQRTKFLEDLHSFTTVKKSRLPNGIVYALIAFMIIVSGVFYYALNEAKEVKYLQEENTFLKHELSKHE